MISIIVFEWNCEIPHRLERGISVSEDVGHRKWWIVRSHVDWRGERVPMRTLGPKGGKLWNPTLIGEGSESRRERCASKRVDCEIAHWLERGTKHSLQSCASKRVNSKLNGTIRDSQGQKVNRIAKNALNKRNSSN